MPTQQQESGDEGGDYFPPGTDEVAEVKRDGIERIKAERERQISKEGWTPEHDDEHTDGAMVIAAACYAVNGTDAMCIDRACNRSRVPDLRYDDAWPWSSDWDKRETHSRIRQLEIAGALIAAEIDRLQRSNKDGH